jgi:hypothetical protein
MWWRIVAGLGWTAVICLLGWVLNLSGKQSPPAVVVLLTTCAGIILLLSLTYPGKLRRSHKLGFNTVAVVVVAVVYAFGLRFFAPTHAKVASLPNDKPNKSTEIPKSSPPKQPEEPKPKEPKSGELFRELQPETYTIVYGGRTFPVHRSELKSGHSFGPNDSIDGKPPFSFYLDKNGLPAIKLTVYGRGGKPYFKLEGHDFVVTPDGWDRNWNEHAIEVVNAQRIPLIRAVWKRNDLLEISGIISSPTGAAIMTISEEWKPLFRYPSWKYPRQVADDADPPPTFSVNPSLDVMSNEQLRNYTLDYLERLHLLEIKYQVDWPEFERRKAREDEKKLIAELVTPLWDKEVDEFRKQYRPQALEIRTALWRRFPSDWRIRTPILGLDTDIGDSVVEVTLKLSQMARRLQP